MPRLPGMYRRSALLVGGMTLALAGTAAALCPDPGTGSLLALAIGAGGLLLVWGVHAIVLAPARQFARGLEAALERERAAGRALALARTRYAALFEQAVDAVLVIDDERVVEANRAAADLFAAGDRTRLIGAPLAALVADEDPDDDATATWGTPGTGSGVDWLMRRLDGSPFRALVRHALTEIDGRTATQMTVVDLGRRNREEQERTLLALLARGTSEAIVVFTPAGLLVYANRAARILLGLGQDGELGRVPMQGLMPEASWRTMRDQAVPAAMAQGGWRGEGELRTTGGTVVPVLQSVVALADRRGRHRLVGMVLRDLTTEQERERQLRAARDAAIDAVRVRQDFLSTVSHELRTPLNGVIGMTSLLATSRLDDEQREFVDTIRVCGENLLALINDILDLGRFESGRMTLERIPFQPRELIETALQIVAERAAAKGIVLAAVVDPLVPAGLVGDPTRLRQVLVNLLSNAVKFTTQGEVVVELRGGGPAPLVLEVRDSGIGIAPEVLPGLFRPFVQGDSSTTRRFGGTGLGLAICRRLVELMGGEISVSSVLGSGSTFTCLLPLPVDAATLQPEPADGPGAPPVLVAHPHPAVRRSITSRLEWLGIPWRTATTGRIADGVPPRAVLAPWELIAGRAGGLAVPPGAALVATAPITGRPDPAQAAGAGVCAVVTEPVRTEHLLQALTAAIRHPAPAHRSRLVLVVDDDAVNRALAMRVIEGTGHRAMAATTAEEALELLAGGGIDLVLMDCQLPGMDGIEATRQLHERERAAGRRTPVVAVTGRTGGIDHQRCRDAGMDTVLAKPYAVDDLAALLRRLLEGG